MTELSALDPQFRPYAERLILMMAHNGYAYEVKSTRRSRKEQRRLYEEFLEAMSLGIPHLPAAPPGHSKHELGLAFDVVFRPEAGQEVAGRAWEDLGGVWGGRFKGRQYDPVHFEAPTLRRGSPRKRRPGA